MSVTETAAFIRQRGEKSKGMHVPNVRREPCLFKIEFSLFPNKYSIIFCTTLQSIKLGNIHFEQIYLHFSCAKLN